MRFNWKGTLFRIHPLTFIMAALACFFGLSADLLATILSLSVHELAHLLAARQLNVMISSIDILPFGGAAHMQNPYSLSRLRLIGVALAGPLGNLAFATICAACAWSGLMDLQWASLLVQSNLILMLFNLLPSLPLDGGRIFFALLSPVLGEKKALILCIWLGRILAATIIACALTAFLHGGKLNLTMLLAAVIIFASGFNERAAQQEARADALSAAFHINPAPHRLNLIAIRDDCPVLDVIRTLRGGEEYLFVMFSRNKSFRFVTQSELLQFLTFKDGEKNLHLPIKAAISSDIADLSLEKEEHLHA